MVLERDECERSLTDPLREGRRQCVEASVSDVAGRVARERSDGAMRDDESAVRPQPDGAQGTPNEALTEPRDE